MQDIVALAVSIAAAAWLVRTVARGFLSPPCRPPEPGGADGFVPLEAIIMRPRPTPAGTTNGPAGGKPDQYMS